MLLSRQHCCSIFVDLGIHKWPTRARAFCTSSPFSTSSKTRPRSTSSKPCCLSKYRRRLLSTITSTSCKSKWQTIVKTKYSVTTSSLSLPILRFTNWKTWTMASSTSLWSSTQMKSAHLSISYRRRTPNTKLTNSKQKYWANSRSNGLTIWVTQAI